MAQVRKAVITAAGRGTRQYPATNSVQKELIPLVDVDGYTKPTLQVIIEEALDAGIEELCVVANPTNLEPVRNHFRGMTPTQRDTQFKGKEWALALSDKLDDIRSRTTFVVQETQEGYGHAVYQAKEWAGDEPFLLLLGDHVYWSNTDARCSRQVIRAFDREQAPVSSVTRNPEATIHRYGTITGNALGGSPAVYEITDMVEKPTVEYAREHLRAPGVPEGEYLCFFGLHVFPADIFRCLETLIHGNIREKGEIQLTSAQQLLLRQQRYVACEVDGVRYDTGVPDGLIETQIALALHSPYREIALAAASGKSRH